MSPRIAVKMFNLHFDVLCSQFQCDDSAAGIVRKANVQHKCGSATAWFIDRSLAHIHMTGKYHSTHEYSCGTVIEIGFSAVF